MLIVAAVVIVVVIASLRTLAIVYTDALWFGSVGFSSVWHRLFEVKAGLFVGFALIFFAFLWLNLVVVDRLAPSELALGPEDELVRRYQRAVAPHALLVRTAVSLVLALIAASSAIGEWQNYLLYRNGVSFTGPGSTDPQFHRNIGWFMFKLPFEQFVVGWAFVALVVVTVVTLVAHYLNGGIRVQSNGPRVTPAVKAHLSVLIACIAVVKAFGYVLQRYGLDLSSNGYVNGAGYTDVHARIPALELLVLISVAAAVLLLFNIWRRGWALPVLAVGLWAFVAVVVGAIYPAVVQAVKVNPAQNTLEAPYIARNIAATRTAMGIAHVKQVSFAADKSATSQTLEADASSLLDVSLWDPSLTNPTFTKLQQTKSYYAFNTLALDRYFVNGQLTPEVVGVRQINQSDLPSSGWVNTHLQYTHGYGMVIAPANQADSNGQPVFSVQNVPPVSAPGLPQILQPSVYFGVAGSGGDSGYVVADTTQPEIDYQASNGNNRTSHYHGTGGVQLNNFLTRAAFALRFGDAKLLISNDITSKSRLMFVRDIRNMAAKAAPFLRYDSSPYPVLVGGHIKWVLDAYTVSADYPYGQPADTNALPPDSGLAGQNFNYIRNSVKVVVDAYSGTMKFYVMDPSDPIIRTWEKVFPHLFTPGSQMPPDLQAHIRYPKDIFTVQAAAYGRYHITNPAAFYNNANGWVLSQSPGSGAPGAALSTTFTTNAQGQTVSTGQVERMKPLYETFRVPGENAVSYNLIDAFVPVSNGQIQTLSAFLVAGSDPGHYGQLTSFVTPPGQNVDGPALIDARIASDTTISSTISLLDQHGSNVLLGHVEMVPVGQSMLYFRPLYVSSSRNAVPALRDVIVAYSGPNGATELAMQSTLSAALQKVFTGLTLPGAGSQSSSPSSAPPAKNPQVQALVTQANQQFAKAQSDLKNLDYAAYGQDLAALQSTLQQLQQLENPGSSSSSSGASASTSSSTSTTPPVGTSSTRTAHSTSRSGSAGSGTSVPSTTSTTSGLAAGRPR